MGMIEFKDAPVMHTLQSDIGRILKINDKRTLDKHISQLDAKLDVNMLILDTNHWGACTDGYPVEDLGIIKEDWDQYRQLLEEEFKE